MANDELVIAVIDASYEEGGRRKLNCADAFKLAERLKVALHEVSRVCNERNIRISNCQLGCFK
ncbi:MAG: hypothetical protein DRH70_00815 [Candidatus Coatesbacteria bacterium]|nr:MAG: hypothetical protein DRH70_00815 [Candidatus Coatesbacteria bacterium]